MHNGRSCHSTTSDPCGWLPVDQPNDTCLCASRVPSFVCVLRWIPMMAVVVVVVEHLLLIEAAETALVATTTLACNIF